MCAGGRAGRHAGAQTHTVEPTALSPPRCPRRSAHRDGRTPPMLEGPLWTNSVVKLGGRVSWTGAASGRLICSSSCPCASTARFTTSRPLRVSNLTSWLGFWHSAGAVGQTGRQGESLLQLLQGCPAPSAGAGGGLAETTTNNTGSCCCPHATPDCGLEVHVCTCPGYKGAGVSTARTAHSAHL